MAERLEKFDKSKIRPGGKVKLTPEQDSEFKRQEALADAEFDARQAKKKQSDATKTQAVEVLQHVECSEIEKT
jgi:hypothetical protein